MYTKSIGGDVDACADDAKGIHAEIKNMTDIEKSARSRIRGLTGSGILNQKERNISRPRAKHMSSANIGRDKTHEQTNRAGRVIIATLRLRYIHRVIV